MKLHKIEFDVHKIELFFYICTCWILFSWDDSFFCEVYARVVKWFLLAISFEDLLWVPLQIFVRFLARSFSLNLTFGRRTPTFGYTHSLLWSLAHLSLANYLVLFESPDRTRTESLSSYVVRHVGGTEFNSYAHNFQLKVNFVWPHCSASGVLHSFRRPA